MIEKALIEELDLFLAGLIESADLLAPPLKDPEEFGLYLFARKAAKHRQKIAAIHKTFNENGTH